ncbi:hypothetical protein [Algoriphagus winogradskyi]|uniref:DUF3347 domain-containing protein n=1 Tax=Algoriphagus winogradskyi TaxID=237017 RepID=A0ABY1PI57_9BACT|nr:hypothetical protein [Algoriphagus winogradskyi]SMP33157.1 hypothetical protein SAMN06265367_108125 [Algoriphagus winogradskyi]
MKTNLITAFIFLLAAISFQASSQTIKLPTPDFKKDMLGAFAPGDDLGITKDQKDKLSKSNSSFFDKVIGIAGSDESDDKKIAKISGLAKEQNSMFESILGEKTVKEYRKKIKKQIRPFTTKYKLAKFVL